MGTLLHLQNKWFQNMPLPITRRSKGWGMLGQMFHTGICDNPGRNLASQCCPVELSVDTTSHTHSRFSPSSWKAQGETAEGKVRQGDSLFFEGKK